MLAYSTGTFHNFPSAKEKETYVCSSYIQHRRISTRYCHVMLFIFVARLEKGKIMLPLFAARQAMADQILQGVR
jgi:hypothetical protein